MSKFSNSSDEIRLNVVKKLNSVIDNKYLSKMTEKGIYNYVIETAKDKLFNVNGQIQYLKTLFLKSYFYIFKS